MSRWYGSLQNRLAESCDNPKPEVGMGVTEFCWSDRHAFEVIAIKDDRHITIRRLAHKRVDHNGLSDCQDYEYASDPDGYTKNLFLTKQGDWRERYGSRQLGTTIFGLGYAQEYYDPCF